MNLLGGTVLSERRFFVALLNVHSIDCPCSTSRPVCSFVCYIIFLGVLHQHCQSFPFLSCLIFRMRSFSLATLAARICPIIEPKIFDRANELVCLVVISDRAKAWCWGQSPNGSSARCRRSADEHEVDNVKWSTYGWTNVTIFIFST